MFRDESPSGIRLDRVGAEGVPEDVLKDLIFKVEMEWNRAEKQGYSMDCEDTLTVDIIMWRKSQAKARADELTEQMNKYGIDGDLATSLLSGDPKIDFADAFLKVIDYLSDQDDFDDDDYSQLPKNKQEDVKPYVSEHLKELYVDYEEQEGQL